MRVSESKTANNVYTYSRAPGPSSAGLTATAYTHGTSKMPPMEENFEQETPSSNDTIQARVKEVKLLANVDDEMKYRIDLELPEGSTYETGDVLKIIPPNIQQIGEGFQQRMRNVRNSMAISGGTVLFSEADMCQPTTLEQLEGLMQCCTNDYDRAIFQAARKSFCGAPNHLRPSVLQLLEGYPSIIIQAHQLSAILPEMSPRSYFISSSPLKSPSTCSLICSMAIRKTRGLSNEDGDTSIGMASHYLSQLRAGDSVACSVEAFNTCFRPPTELSTPLIMISDGVGIAPFVGFVMHRAEQLRRRPALWDIIAPALLFVGCRSLDDSFCVSELGSSGVVDVRYALSRGAGNDFQGDVQDRVWADRQDVMTLWNIGAKVYICGSQSTCIDTEEVLRKMVMEGMARRETKTDESFQACSDDFKARCVFETI
ncbi:Bifunctional cytochrome P450 [Colletotrichum gloeosporioides]|uniref:Bifunctional cytochrome P450 n=1 Tax=Colletotrichum gloeosporioides TaxID=474922 RepID=A0A8H4FPC2_COLGL|nr:Bifunctional cytochrome P450 [Colletotrichum gloeosporioides]KAF3809376.1 Bifunctional cytochrome P450 [Colletotrichum gloeosporioides]